MNNENREIEVRFLEIDKEALVKKLQALGARDLGEEMLEEIIFYRPGEEWQAQGKKFVRLRTGREGSVLTYKHHETYSIDGTEEIEFTVSDPEQATAFMERIGLPAFRHQQKKRHTFKLQDITVDIDTWPKVPTYVELEGATEEHLKKIAVDLGLDWKDAVFENAREVIQKYYKIPVGDMKWFTFDRVE